MSTQNLSINSNVLQLARETQESICIDPTTPDGRMWFKCTSERMLDEDLDLHVFLNGLIEQEVGSIPDNFWAKVVVRVYWRMELVFSVLDTLVPDIGTKVLSLIQQECEQSDWPSATRMQFTEAEKLLYVYLTEDLEENSITEKIAMVFVRAFFSKEPAL